MMFLILMGLAVTTQIELGTSSVSKQQTQARMNALFGLNVALGNLQQQLGMDQRTSASPIYLQSDLAETAPTYHWTGVWDTQKVSADGSANLNYGKNIGWLVSGYEKHANAIPPVGNLLRGDGTPVDPDTSVVLVGAGTTTGVSNYVAAPKVDIDSSGEYAYWIADEGRKADVNLTSRLERGDAAHPDVTPNVMSRMELSAPTRYQPHVINGLESIKWEDSTELAKAVDRTSSAQDMILADPALSNGSSTWGAALREHFHDVTYNSISLQTNTRDGGLKKDLSLLFEMDDDAFALTPYSGETARPEFADWSQLPPTDGDSYIDPATNDQVSYLFMEPVPEHGDNAFIRGPTWHKLRDFYRLYKDITKNNTRPTVTMRPFGPNAEDLGVRGGEKGYFWTLESDHGGDIKNGNNYVNTTVNTKTGFANEPVTRLTEHEVMPIMNRVIYIFSLYEDQNVPEYEYIPEGETTRTGGTAPRGGVFESTGGTTDAISLVIEPVVCLWNPYNVAMKFNGGIKIQTSGAFGYLFSLAPSTLTAANQHLPNYQTTSGNNLLAFNNLDKNILSIPQITCELAATRRIMEPGYFGAIDLIIGDVNSTIVLEPGEVRFFSDPRSEPTPYTDLIPVADENTRAIQLAPGFNKQGGILLGRRLNTFHDPANNGIIHQVNSSNSPMMDLNIYPWTGFSKSNWGDRRSITSNNITTTKAYVPESELSNGGSLVETDTTIQQIFIALHGPKENGKAENLHHLLYGQGGSGGQFPMLINPAAIGSYPNKRMPFMYIGLYQNPVLPDLALVPSPAEFIGSMSPFSGNVDGQFSHGVESTPYTYQMGPMSNYTDIQALNDRGFFGEGYSSESESHLVVSEIPTYPLRSLASLQHAHIADSAYMPGQAIANSWPGGGFELDGVIGENNNARYTQYDLSYLSNQALFDDYFFSSLTPQMDLSADVQQVENLTTTLSNIVETSRTTNKLPELSNERMKYVGPPDLMDGSQSAESSQFVQDLGAVDGFSKTARYFATTGGFNVNSLSVDAWDALLASTLGNDFTYLDPLTGYATENNAEYTIFPRTTLPNGPVAEAWRGPKGLDAIQRRALAQAIVNEVKERGPFLSLSDFVNRELSKTDNGKKGVIQAAIDSLGINKDFLYEDAYTEAKSYFHKENLTAKTGVGLPQYLTQADVLTPLAPYLSARSDTFIIRSYGNAKNQLTDGVEAEAVIEVLVRRTPEFVESAADSPDTHLTHLSSDVNKQFGRRFEIIYARWLSKEDI
ncbi:hypothetical protein [Cerasicoccus fimbriatus]|uniref:hypothetical protein n=1 Tax=Cerasicoccus fimbriatus TaxID=3014554 RepID=UPI0022B4C8F3|nr:hypothetical protein [Cerasicoccus sp. TK19100]